jgi:hypothetical protein
VVGKSDTVIIHARKAEPNTFGLPEGDDVRKELVRMFRAQQREILARINPPIKSTINPTDAGLPGPDWWAQQTLAEVERMTPLIEAYWQTAGEGLYSRIGLDPNAWQVTSPYTQEAIRSATFEFCDATNATTSQEIHDALADLEQSLEEGITQTGDSVRVLTDRVMAIFDNAERWRARRIAQTETARAVHSAQQTAGADSGVISGWEWLLSTGACPICYEIHDNARYVRVGQSFATVGNHPTYSDIRHPPAHPGCCLPETPVRAPGAIAGMRAQYDGPIVRIHLIDGSQVAVTANHMLLTVDGFAAADSLMDGDDLICSQVGQGIPLGTPDDDHVPATIGEIVEAWSKAAGVLTTGVPVAAEYLHGDAAFCDGKIDVVSPNRLLGNYHDTPGGEHLGQLGLVHADNATDRLDGAGDLASLLLTLSDATDGGVGILRETHARFRRHLRHADRVGLGPVTDRAAGGDETTNNGRTGHTNGERKSQYALAGSVSGHQIGNVRWDAMASGSFEREAIAFEAVHQSSAREADRLRQALDGLAGKVATVKIERVERSHYRGPVYDLTTTTSLYTIGSGIVSSNCRCTLLEVLLPEYGGPIDQPQWTETPLDQPGRNAEDQTDEP